MLGPVRWVDLQPAIPQWVIIGMASGSANHVGHLKWVRDLVADCRAEHVPVFVKQLGKSVRVWDPPISTLNFRDPKGGNMEEWPEDLRVREMPDCISRMPLCITRT
jgi:protein gp37